MKKIIIPLLVLGLIGAGIGYYMYNKPVERLEKKQAEVSVSADQLVSDYETNENEADAKYLGKIVEVNGKVSQITSEEGINKVHLETSNPIAAVICDLDKGNEPGNLKVGDQAKIKGMCSGYLGDVIIDRSSIVR
jgi:hypothetical protein